MTLGATLSWNVTQLLYLITIVSFILALRFLSNPAHARRGNQIGAVGMADRDRRDVDQHRHDELVGDRHRDADRRRLRSRRGAQGEDDRDAADGGAVQRRRRRRGDAHRARGAAPDPPGAGHAEGRHLARDLALGAHRLDLVLRLDGRVREAPGADRRPSDHVRRPAVRQRRALPRRTRLRDRARRRRAGRVAALGARRRGARVRRPVRAPDRRRRHAGRDLAAQRVHRPRRRARRLRAREQRPHRRRDARRRVGHAPHADDGAGDEPLHRERPLRRVRDRSRPRRRRSPPAARAAGRCAARAPTTSP